MLKTTLSSRVLSTISETSTYFCSQLYNIITHLFPVFSTVFCTSAISTNIEAMLERKAEKTRNKKRKLLEKYKQDLLKAISK